MDSLIDRHFLFVYFLNGERIEKKAKMEIYMETIVQQIAPKIIFLNILMDFLITYF